MFAAMVPLRPLRQAEPAEKKTGLSARGSTLIAVGGPPAAGFTGFVSSFRERGGREGGRSPSERNARRRTGSHITGFICCCEKEHRAAL